MFKICGYYYQEDISAIILANIYRSTKTDERGTRSNDNVISIENVLVPSPNNFINIANELEDLKETTQLHIAQYEPLKMRLGLECEYLHHILHINVWNMAEELHNFLISQNRLIVNCELNLTKEFVKKSFHTLLSGSLYHICPKAEYRSQEIQDKNFPLLLEYVKNPTPHPLEPEKHWNGDLITMIKY